MGQKRAITGNKFEQELLTMGYEKEIKSPRLSWNGKGRNVFQKIKNLNYDVTEFTLDFEKSKFKKCDVKDKETNEVWDAKRYDIDHLNHWILYSEPFFKVAVSSQLSKIGINEYNLFVENFYQYHIQTGLLDQVCRKIFDSSSGIILLGNKKIRKENLEYRVGLRKNYWKGYHRILMEVRMRNNF